MLTRQFAAKMLFRAALALWVMQVAFSQQLGHYLQGFGGLGSGSPLPHGYYFSYLPYFANYNTLRGPNGGSLALGDFKSGIHNVNVTYMAGKKLGGFEYGFAGILPFVNTRLGGDQLPSQISAAGVSDILVMPVMLGRRKPQADFIFNYAFVAPTGSFDPTQPANAGLGFWTHLFQTGSSFGFDKTRTWNGTVLTTWEVHTKKKGVDVTTGPGMTLEYAAGRRFLKGLANVGAAGYYYQKLVSDSGADINPVLVGYKDRVFGLGPEFQMIVPQWKLAFMFRFQPQFGARSRLEANVFIASVTYMHTLQ